MPAESMDFSRVRSERVFFFDGEVQTGVLVWQGIAHGANARVAPVRFGFQQTYARREAMMDHRMNMRVGVELPVEISTTDRTVRGLAIGLSFEGLRVSLDNDPPLPTGMVWVCLEPDTIAIKVQAMVIHQNDVEVGLMFGHYDQSVEVYLGNCVTEALEHAVRRPR